MTTTTEGDWLHTDGRYVRCNGHVIASMHFPRQPDETQMPGESWLDMRTRTAPERSAIADEVEANARMMAASKLLMEALTKTLAGYISASKDAMRIDGEKDEAKLLTFMDDDPVVVLAVAALARATASETAS